MYSAFDIVMKQKRNIDRAVLALMLVYPGFAGGWLFSAKTKTPLVTIREMRPGVKVLFMSGHTADIIESKGILAEGIPFLSKPIIPDQLPRKVREVLDG